MTMANGRLSIRSRASSSASPIGTNPLTTVGESVEKLTLSIVYNFQNASVRSSQFSVLSSQLAVRLSHLVEKSKLASGRRAQKDADYHDQKTFCPDISRSSLRLFNDRQRGPAYASANVVGRLHDI